MLADLDADLPAFSIRSPHWYPMEDYLAELKRLIPDVPILIGGYQAMMAQDQTIANPNVDFICVGDGEYAIGNLVEHLTGRRVGAVDGMCEKLIGGTVHKTEAHQIGDLSALPFPDYDVFAKADGFKDVHTSIIGPEDKLVLPVMTGRG
ncbi:MAG: anaerobic magnesium-protoporphyrin IX monomethyl ester cyclase, partial [Planctomycetota bacterium]